MRVRTILNRLVDFKGFVLVKEVLGIDEIQFGKGHQYLTVAYQLCGKTRRLLYVGQ